jgi:thiosulfate/3-mercaptopyruvate sulfurtransferase
MEHLIEPLLLKKYLNDKQNLVIVDLRWYANAPGKGHKEWETSRIPGAVFIDLDHELSDHSSPEKGRHPLPDPHIFAETLAKKGIGKDSFIVVYDAAAGAIAARLWWMMRWIKGPETKILNGGFQAWKVSGFPVESGPSKEVLKENANPIVPEPQNHLFVDRHGLAEELGSGRITLIDARDKERYLGITEPIDPVAGHIPGAINSPYKENLTGDVPEFLSPEELRKHFSSLGINSDSKVVSYCGSGVTSCHNILALELAGFPESRLYPGSWSEWCRNL